MTAPDVAAPAVDAAELLHEIASTMQDHDLPAPGIINLGYLPDRVEIHLPTITGEHDLALWAAALDHQIEAGPVHVANQPRPWQEMHVNCGVLHVWYARYMIGPQS